MALQLWMPLMGDIRNQGLGNYLISTLGILSWVPGKLGATAMRGGDGTQVINGLSINNNFTTLLNGDYSISVWIKPYGTHVHYNGSIMSSGNWNTANKRWAFGVNQDNTKVDVLGFNYNTYIDCPVPVNDWTHLICTCGSDRKIKLYKNGIYIGERDGFSDPAIDSDASVTCIGRESYANGYFSFNGAIQDLRLYNHCLSELEIKQLSQGLIVHYPLNRMGFGQDNLATCTTSQYTISASSTSNYNYFWINSSTLEPNTTYTFSAEVEVSDNIKQCTIYNYTSSGNSGSLTHTFPADGKRHSWTFTTTTTGLGLIGYAGNSGATAGHSAIYRNIKVEKGNKATPYIPRSNEALYTTMGLNGTTEYDTSGYCNNGTRTGTFSWTSDTPKYGVNTKFSGSNYILTDSGTFSWFSFDELTLTGWMKPTNSPSSYSGSFGIAHNSIDGYYSKCFSISNSNSKFTINAAKGSTWVWITSSYVVPTNEWHHYAATLSGTEVKMYVDGELIHSATIDWNTAKVASDTRFQVGVDLPGSDETYQGYYSDIRAYATALSASDVKSLYQNCATIDPDGTIRGQIRS